jgi:hypothetical protein
MNWTADDQGIYIADLVAGELEVFQREIVINTFFTADEKELLNAALFVN